MLRSFLLFASIALIPTSACAHNFAPASARGYSLQLEDQYGNALDLPSQGRHVRLGQLQHAIQCPHHQPYGTRSRRS